MSLPIEKWARQATLLDAPPRGIIEDDRALGHYEKQFWARQPMGLDDLGSMGQMQGLCNGEPLGGTGDRIAQMAELNARPWKQVDNELAAVGDPTALAGGFAGLELTPLPGAYAQATILTTEVAVWTANSYTPIAANPQCPKVYRLVAFGTSFTAATQGTMAFNARFGILITSPLIGASTTAAQTTNQSQTPFLFRGDVVVLKGGIATSGQVVSMFNYQQGTTATGGSLSLAGLNQWFGTTTGAVSVVTDGSVAAALWMGGIAVTSTTNAYTPQAVIWASWN